MPDQNNHPLEPIMARLLRIEDQNGKLARQNRYLRHGLTIIGLLLTMLIVMGQAFPKNTIEASKFILRDEAGRARAKLMIKDDEPSLTLFDKKEHERIVLTIDHNDPAIALIGKNYSIHASLSLLDDTPLFVLLNKDNQPIFRAPQ